VGDQIAELKGKIITQRVLDAQSPTMETSVSASGSIKRTQVNETLTFMAKPTSAGILHGVGQGVLMAGESEIASYTGEGIGRLTTSGAVKWLTSAVIILAEFGTFGNAQGQVNQTQGNVTVGNVTLT
jgi:hypothetical protein